MAFEKGLLIEALQALDRQMKLVERLSALVIGQKRGDARVVGAGDGIASASG